MNETEFISWDDLKKEIVEEFGPLPLPRKLQHWCPRCSARWNGKKTAHCGSCHETFSGPSAFDQHRAGGMCVQADPVTMMKYGLALQERAGYEVWGYAGTDERWDNEDGDEDE